MKKKILALGLVVIMAVCLAACGSSSEKSASKDSAEGDLTIKEGVLMVGMEIGYPPMEYFDSDGTTPIGFDIDVAQALADQLGLELELVDTSWDGIFAGVDTGKYDVIISCVSDTPEREEAFYLTKPYVSNHTVLIVPNDSEIDSMEALAGHSTAVQAETTSDDYMKANGDAIGISELYQYDKVINCFDDLKSGRCDSVFTDSVVAAYYLGDEASNYKTVWENEELEPISMCLKKDNAALGNAIDDALDALYADGTLAEIAEKHFGTDLSAGLRDE